MATYTVEEAHTELLKMTSYHLIELSDHTHALATCYQQLGQNWHSLPLQLRWHTRLRESIILNCSEAFTVNACRQLPTLLTLFGTLSMALRRGEAALQEGQTAVAGEIVHISSELVREAEERVTNLELCLEVLDTLGWICDVEGESEEWDKRHKLKSKMKKAWLHALPGCCFEEEQQEDRSSVESSEVGGWAS